MSHRHRKVSNIVGGGGCNFQNIGGRGWGQGPRRGPNFLLAVNRLKSPPPLLPPQPPSNQCQIITFLVLKIDNIEKLRI